MTLTFNVDPYKNVLFSYTRYLRFNIPDVEIQLQMTKPALLFLCETRIGPTLHYPTARLKNAQTSHQNLITKIAI